MQSLYTFKSKKDQSILNGEKDMLKHIEDISKLQIVVISFLLFLFRHAQNFFEENKSKFLPKDEDINPNLRFIDNSFYKFFFKNKTHISMYENIHSFGMIMIMILLERFSWILLKVIFTLSF